MSHHTKSFETDATLMTKSAADRMVVVCPRSLITTTCCIIAIWHANRSFIVDCIGKVHYTVNDSRRVVGRLILIEAFECFTVNKPLTAIINYLAYLDLRRSLLRMNSYSLG